MQKQNGKKINKPAKFIRILYSMFQIPDCFLQWNQTQENFTITNISSFISKSLPKFFKHKNIASFIRQLNLYGFKKVTDEGGRQNSYQHSNFKKGKPRLLSKIKKKNARKKSTKQKNEVKIEEEDEQKRITKKQIKESILECQNQLKQLQNQNIKLFQQGKYLRDYLTELSIQNQNFLNILPSQFNHFAFSNFSNIYNYNQQYQNILSNLQSRNSDQMGMIINGQQQAKQQKNKKNIDSSQDVSAIKK